MEGSDDPQAELADREAILPTMEQGEKVKLADVEVVVAEIELSVGAAGAVVSAALTAQVWVAFAPAVPSEFTSCTAKVWFPTASPAKAKGELHGSKPPPSRLHSKPA